jgi:hypothetical protein
VTLADPTTAGDLIQDLTAQINPPRALLLHRLNSTQLLPIQQLTGFLCEIRRLSVSSSCRLLLSFSWTFEPTVHICSPADLTTDAPPPELTHFLPNLGRISIFQRPRPLLRFCELLDYESCCAYENAGLPELLRILRPLGDFILLLPQMENELDTLLAILSAQASCLSTSGYSTTQ